jgi:ZIP family zinc transporter
MIIATSILASVAAFLGGWIALTFKDRLHIILGLSAGAVIGAALFDLIPEAIEIGSPYFEPSQILLFTGMGFFSYLVLDRLFSFHEHTEIGDEDGHTKHKGTLGAASFALHSLIDGIAIGTAFQVSAAIGAVVAVAVIAHRFSDGINTVGVILKNNGGNIKVYRWLIIVALSPIVGALSTYFCVISESMLAILLSVFAGFFLYIGGSDLIPEGHHSHSRFLTTLMTLVGALILYGIVHLA